MITSNADQIAKELQRYADDVERRLKAMVAGFAGELALRASSNTSVATPELIQRWHQIYATRSDELGIDMAPGYHAGSWQYAEGSLTFDPTIRSRQMVENQAEGEARAMYKLGDTFNIGAIGPNFDYLEDRDRILDHTAESVVTSAYATNLKMHYDLG